MYAPISPWITTVLPSAIQKTTEFVLLFLRYQSRKERTVSVHIRNRPGDACPGWCQRNGTCQGSLVNVHTPSLRQHDAAQGAALGPAWTSVAHTHVYIHCPLCKLLYCMHMYCMSVYYMHV